MEFLHQSGILHLLVALSLGAAIGLERQWRQRLAGLRTNTLVALGAAAFVVFSIGTPGEASPTRVAAQVVSGIGFLGAGIIFREGFNVRGLNTAATLWCSAAVGVLAGAGSFLLAAVVAGLVVLTNLALRPLAALINRQPLLAPESDTAYAVTIVCRAAQEAHVRALLLQGLASAGLRLRGLDSHDLDEADKVEIAARVLADQRADRTLEQIIGRISLEPGVTAARWRVGEQTE
ncbi:MAG: MgtC/SapB family protein [Geminicoccaceae bacterium]|nr:MgtC/SapB family protein [Geminicoccaceae bacterium]MCX7630761.1 MgtC/SapB family protein [Geminicoccaceae bacterium]MDW8124398.1 MgtC/SapB family protein [Geminicoccaceae bacterium]